MVKKQYTHPEMVESVGFDGADAILSGSPHGTLETPVEDEIEIELL